MIFSGRRKPLRALSSFLKYTALFVHKLAYELFLYSGAYLCIGIVPEAQGTERRDISAFHAYRSFTFFYIEVGS